LDRKIIALAPTGLFDRTVDRYLVLAKGIISALRAAGLSHLIYRGAGRMRAWHPRTSSCRRIVSGRT